MTQVMDGRRGLSVRIDGARLRLELVRRGLDQGELAKRANLRPETISRAVTGHPVRSSTLSAIADVLTNVPVRSDVDGLLAEPEKNKRPRANSQTLISGAQEGPQSVRSDSDS